MTLLITTLTQAFLSSLPGCVVQEVVHTTPCGERHDHKYARYNQISLIRTDHQIERFVFAISKSDLVCPGTCSSTPPQIQYAPTPEYIGLKHSAKVIVGCLDY